MSLLPVYPCSQQRPWKDINVRPKLKVTPITPRSDVIWGWGMVGSSLLPGCNIACRQVDVLWDQALEFGDLRWSFKPVSYWGIFLEEYIVPWMKLSTHLAAELPEHQHEPQ